MGEICFRKSIIGSGLNFLFCFKNIDVIQVIKIFSIETSKDDHVASDKTCTVSPSGLWKLGIGFHGFHCLFF